MDDNDKSFYNPVTAKEKLYVMEYLGKEKRPIVMQLQSGKTFKSHVLGSSRKEVRIQDVADMGAKSGDTVSFVILFDRNKYWFRGPVEKVRGYLVFNTEVEVRKIQRRENFRATVPATCPVEIQIDMYEGQEFGKSFSVMDISYGGCQFEVNGTNLPFVDGGAFEGSLESSKAKSSIPVYGTIRRVIKDKEHGFMRIGVQFESHTRGVETPLMDLIMRCARESQKYESL